MNLPFPTHRAFTLLEVMVAATMTAIVLVATLTGVVALQKSYAATEEYATGMADQARLLDYLALDLRRAAATEEYANGQSDQARLLDSLAQDLRRALAVPATQTAAAQPAWSMDADDQGLTINVPNYYHFNASDPQHSFPVANDPVYDPITAVVTYPDPSNPTVTTQKITYRFDHGSIVRTDPWQALAYSSGSGKYASTGAVTVASNMDAFPTITADPAWTDGSIVRYNVTFHSIFRPLAASDKTNAITLHNVTFIRSKNLSR